MSPALRRGIDTFLRHSLVSPESRSPAFYVELLSIFIVRVYPLESYLVREIVIYCNPIALAYLILSPCRAGLRTVRRVWFSDRINFSCRRVHLDLDTILFPLRVACARCIDC